MDVDQDGYKHGQEVIHQLHSQRDKNATFAEFFELLSPGAGIPPFTARLRFLPLLDCN